MAITGNAILLPLDGLGAQSGKTYNTSSRDSRMEPLSAEGHQWNHYEGAITLPSLTADGTGQPAIAGNGDVRLPRLTVAGYGGGTGRPILPALVVTAAGTVNPVGVAEIVLPQLVTAGEGITGSIGEAAATLPMLAVAGYGAGYAALALPRLAVAGTGASEVHGTAALVLPLLRTSGESSIVVYGGSTAAVLLPALAAGPSGAAAILLPRLFTSSVPAASGEYEAWVLNVRNNGVTRWTNFPFDRIVRVGNQHYGLRAEGVYLLGGDYDEVDPAITPKPPVAWSFETGLGDFGAVGMKHVPYVYLDGIIVGDIFVTLLDDKGREFKYAYSTKSRGAVHMPHRRKLGNGIRTRNVAFRISTETGAYIELDAIEPETTVTQRSV